MSRRERGDWHSKKSVRRKLTVTSFFVLIEVSHCKMTDNVSVSFFLKKKRLTRRERRCENLIVEEEKRGESRSGPGRVINILLDLSQNCSGFTASHKHGVLKLPHSMNFSCKMLIDYTFEIITNFCSSFTRWHSKKSADFCTGMKCIPKIEIFLVNIQRFTIHIADSHSSIIHKEN